MVYFLIYDCGNEAFLENIICGSRQGANKWCDYLEQKRGGLFVPVKFVDRKQITEV